MPHYDRHADASAEQNEFHETGGAVDEAAMEDAAEAIRAAEILAVRPDPDIPDLSTLDASKLERMSIDELRVVAKQLDVPDRSKITEQDELIAAIRERLAD
jgi:Rho termination factor, N-terminal domain